MDRLQRITALIIPVAVAGCAATLGTPDDDGRTDSTGTSFALVSSTGEQGVLRTGDSLAVRVGALADLFPDSTYRFAVTAPGGALLSEGDVRTSSTGQVFLATVMHDVGEDGRVAEGARLDVSLRDLGGALAAQTSLQLAGVPALQVPGWNVEEPAPPHVFAADEAGEPANSFAVGGADPGEQVGPVYVAGEGFPENAAGRDVDVYVARDRDEWRGLPMPREGDEGWIAGPIAVRVDESGRLEPTALFTPELGHTGVYDILVDVDRDGLFEWTFESKDGADGLGRVGFTVQYSQAWLRAREQSHILVNIAYSSHSRDEGVWRNQYRRDEPVFLYLNPPVMHRYHFQVTKWIVRHQDFDAYWNNPDVADEDGAVNFAEFAVNSMAEPTERGCTNTGPVCYGVLEITGTTDESFDVVFDRNGDGRYMPGEDLLDVVGGDVGGGLVTVEQLRALPLAQRVGFVVRAR
ncbi:MAG: hypothetical protein M5U28_37195 [Sandaracinaceae bacterium]|nr:hypothetical protein [Sandaracinaceae bacterium]